MPSSTGSTPTLVARVWPRRSRAGGRSPAGPVLEIEPPAEVELLAEAQERRAEMPCAALATKQA